MCSDQREPHIRASNDRFIKLQTLGKISLSGLRIIFNFTFQGNLVDLSEDILFS